MIEILLIFIGILLAVCLCFFVADFVPVFMTWLKRIHIGRYTDKKVWLKTAEKVAEKKHKKTAPYTDNGQGVLHTCAEAEGQILQLLF